MRDRRAAVVVAVALSGCPSDDPDAASSADTSAGSGSDTLMADADSDASGATDTSATDGSADSSGGTDIGDYEDAGIAKDTTFIIGEEAGAEGTVSVQEEDWLAHSAAHLPTVLSACGED